MQVDDKVLKIAEEMLKKKPFDQITFAEIANIAGIHWTAVRKQFGSKQMMKAWLQEKQAEQLGSLADTRTRILEAGEHMFSQLGYANASLDKVASTAGLTKGAVYWHFSSKQDLFLAILDHNLTQQLRILPQEVNDIVQGRNPEDALEHWLQSQFNFLNKEEAGAILFLEFVTSSREPEIQAKLRSIHGRIIDGVAVLLKQMQANGLIRTDLDPQSLSMMLDLIMKGTVVEWVIDPERVRLQPLFKTIARGLWRGLAPYEA